MIPKEILDLVQTAYIQGWKDGERYNRIPAQSILVQDLKNREKSGGAYRLLIRNKLLKEFQ